MNASTDPLALLGGTFDPIHYGHLRCADEVREKLGLEILYLLPAGSPPHRASPQVTNQQRVEMLDLALTEFPNLEIDQRELDRDGPSYMADTLQDIRTAHPHRPVLLVIGQDAANQLQHWHHWKVLFDLAHIIIMTRAGCVADYRPELAAQIEQRTCQDVKTLLGSPAGCVLALQVTPIDICATTIKTMISVGRSPKTMLPSAVLTYIDAGGLYKTR